MKYVLLAWLGSLMFLCGCGGESGPKKFPVQGSVEINGLPAHFVRVQFLHRDQTLPGNLKMPMGMTNEKGQFELSTSGDKDGAVEGEYVVTFEWLSGNDLAAFDKLGGKLADPKLSTYQVRVEPKTNRLPPFQITVPESTILNRPPRTK